MRGSVSRCDSTPPLRAPPPWARLMGQLRHGRGARRLRRRSLKSWLRHDVGWEPAEPTEERKPLEPAKVWKPDEPAEAFLVPPAVATGPDITNKNLPDASNCGVSIL